MCEVDKGIAHEDRLVFDPIYRDGYNAAKDGSSWTDCPYLNIKEGTRRVCNPDRFSWIEGFGYCVVEDNARQIVPK